MEIIDRNQAKPKRTPALKQTTPVAIEKCAIEKVEGVEVPALCTEVKQQGKLKNAASSAGATMKNLFTKQKKLVVVGAMVLLLGVTVYFNFALNREDSFPAGSEVQVNLFENFRNNRADERTRDIMVYENLAATSANAETVTNAEARLLEIRANVAFETSAEGLIMGRQLGDVIVNKANGFVNVIIRRPNNIDRTDAIWIMSTLRTLVPSLDIDDVHISFME